MHMKPYDQAWLNAFVYTQLIEISLGLILVAVLVHLSHQATKIHWLKAGFIIFTASALTHPPLWYILPKLCRKWGYNYHEYLIIGETLVTLAEGLCYGLTLSPIRKQFIKAMLFSVILNTTSALIGMYIL